MAPALNKSAFGLLPSAFGLARLQAERSALRAASDKLKAEQMVEQNALQQQLTDALSRSEVRLQHNEWTQCMISWAQG